MDKKVEWDSKTQTVYIGKKSILEVNKEDRLDEQFLTFENHSKALNLIEAEAFAKLIIEEYAKTMWHQWDWTFKFSDDPQYNMVLIETTFKEQLTLPWEEHPIYNGFNKARQEMKNSGEISDEELEHLTNYIDGFWMEHEHGMEVIYLFGEAPPQKIYIDISNDGKATFYIRGYYKEDKTYSDEYIELGKWLEHKSMTESNKEDISNYAYEILYEELVSLRKKINN